MIQTSELKKYALFGGLLDEQLEGIITLMEREEFSPGEIIIYKGQSNDKIFFIIEGRVAVMKDDVVITHLTEGLTFGEMEVLDVMPAEAAIKADSSVTVLSISNQSLHKIYNMDTKVFSLLLMNLARDLSRRLRLMDEKYTSSSFFLQSQE